MDASNIESGGGQRVFQVLDDIRSELGLVRTDVAVLAAAQPRITDIVEDHERRLRQVEADVVLRAAEIVKLLDALKTQDAQAAITATAVKQLEKNRDENSWMPRITWIVITAILSGLGGAVVSSYVQMLQR